MTTHTILIGGNRHASAEAYRMTLALCAAAHQASYTIHTGDASGVDEVTIQAAQHTTTIHVYAIGDNAGLGYWRCSADWLTLAQPAAQKTTHWLAGGSLTVPLQARLIKRSLSALGNCTLAAWIDPGPGSLAVAAHAATRAIPVYALCAVRPPALHNVAGHWQPAQLLNLSCWQWQPAQARLW
jgi:hypothetical protein